MELSMVIFYRNAECFTDKENIDCSDVAARESSDVAARETCCDTCSGVTTTTLPPTTTTTTTVTTTGRLSAEVLVILSLYKQW